MTVNDAALSSPPLYFTPWHQVGAGKTCTTGPAATLDRVDKQSAKIQRTSKEARPARAAAGAAAAGDAR